VRGRKREGKLPECMRSKVKDRKDKGKRDRRRFEGWNRFEIYKVKENLTSNEIFKLAN